MQRASHVLAIIGLVIFLFFAALGLDKPGVCTAEAQLAMSLAAPNTFPYHEAPMLHILGRTVPLLLQPHIGLPLSVFYAPMLGFCPYNTVTIRIVTVIFGAIALLGAYFLGRQMFGPTVGGLGTFLFAIDANMIFNSRCDWSHTTIGNVAKTWAIYLFLKAIERPTSWSLFLSGFLVGLALWDKLSFAWMVIAFGIALLIVKRKELFAMSMKSKLMFCFGGAVGSLPLLIANVPSLISVLSFFIVGPPTPFSVRLAVFFRTLGGTALHEVYNAMPPWAPPLCAYTDEPLRQTEALMKSVALTAHATPAPVALFVFIASLLLLWTVSRRNERSEEESRLCASLIMTLLMVIVLCLLALTMKATYSPTHFFFLYPFMQYMLAWAFLLPFTKSGKTSVQESEKQSSNASKPTVLLARFISIACFLWLTISCLMIDLITLNEINRYGGRSLWSNCNVQLAEFILQHPSHHVVPMDVNIWPQLFYLTKGKIDGDEYFWPVINAPLEKNETPAEGEVNHLVKGLAPVMNDLKNTVFVFHTPEATQISAVVRGFERMCAQKNLKVVELTTIKQGDGLPIYRIVKLEPATP